jgi:hypothetical protein
MWRRRCEFIFHCDPIFPDRPGPANGDAGSKSVCIIVLRNAIDVCLAAIVVTRADSCPPALAEVVTIKGRRCPQRSLRGLVVSLERIVGSDETSRSIQVDPRHALIGGEVQIHKRREGPAIRPCIQRGISIHALSPSAGHS